MQITSQTPRLGLGCWPLSGAFYAGKRPLHYADTTPAESLRALDAAYSSGIRIFDTAAVYGAGKGERLVGQALKGKPDAIVVTKIGTAMDEASEQMLEDETSADTVAPAIDRCLQRLQRDHIDVLLLHLNNLSVDMAGPIFDEMEEAVRAGKVGSFGWSTDYPDSIAVMAPRTGFTTVEHAMNVFFDVPSVHQAVENNGLWGLVRSPLAMGVLSGKTRVRQDDIRFNDNKWNNYFINGEVNPRYVDRINSVRDLLQSDGRSLVQGALSWVMARGDKTIPLPGGRTVTQVKENAKTLEFGPLAADVMSQIETLMDRSPEGPPRNR